MNRPFYRSRLFWLGVPGSLFLAWLWIDSTRFTTEVTQRMGTREVYFLSYGGRVQLTATLLTHYSSTSSSIVRVKDSMEASWLPPIDEVIQVGAEPDPFAPDHVGGDRKWWGIQLPVWTLIALYGFAWACAVAWWQCRKSRQLKLHTAPTP